MFVNTPPLHTHHLLTILDGGAYAEYIAVSSHMLIHKPEHMSWEEAAGIPEVCCPYMSVLVITT